MDDPVVPYLANQLFGRLTSRVADGDSSPEVARLYSALAAYLVTTFPPRDPEAG